MGTTPDHVIEERMKKEGKLVRDYIQESIRNLSVCHFCKKELQNTAFKCKWCLHNFCSEHKTPQAHKCPVYFSRMGAGSKAVKSDPREHTSVLKASRKVHSPISLKAVVIVMSLIILVGSFLIALSNYDLAEQLDIGEDKPKYINVTEIVLVNKTVLEDVPDEISFDEYLENVTYYDGMHANLTGFLSYRLELDEDDTDAGQYVEKIVDDFGEKIKLVDLKAQHKKYFTLKEVSKQLYEVSGTFERRYKVLQLKVDSISEGSRINKTIEKIVSVEKQVVVQKEIDESTS